MTDAATRARDAELLEQVRLALELRARHYPHPDYEQETTEGAFSWAEVRAVVAALDEARADAARYRALAGAAYQVTVEEPDPSVGLSGWVDVSLEYAVTARNATTLEHVADALVARERYVSWPDAAANARALADAFPVPTPDAGVGE